jgi:hypothetical protein
MPPDYYGGNQQHSCQDDRRRRLTICVLFAQAAGFAAMPTSKKAMMR